MMMTLLATPRMNKFPAIVLPAASAINSATPPPAAHDLPRLKAHVLDLAHRNQEEDGCEQNERNGKITIRDPQTGDTYRADDGAGGCGASRVRASASKPRRTGARLSGRRRQPAHRPSPPPV